jgi:hypothetical protein
LKNGDLLRQRKNPDRLCMRNTLRGLDFSASLHLTIFERPVYFELRNRKLKPSLGDGSMSRFRRGFLRGAAPKFFASFALCQADPRHVREMA